jgi:hypothetical protein
MNCSVQIQSNYPFAKEQDDQNIYVQAGHQTTPATLLRDFARSDCPIIRARIAENKATPLPILFELLLDTNSDVRISLSQNPSLPMIFLTQLARDEDPDVRYGMAENTFLPVNILEILANDENPYVSHRALKSLSLAASENAFVRKERDLKVAA